MKTFSSISKDYVSFTNKNSIVYTFTCLRESGYILFICRTISVNRTTGESIYSSWGESICSYWGESIYSYWGRIYLLLSIYIHIRIDVVVHTKVALKVMHSILKHWFTMSEADIGSTAVEGEPSCQQPIFALPWYSKQSGKISWHERVCEVEVYHWIPSCLKNCTHCHSSTLAEHLRRPNNVRVSGNVFQQWWKRYMWQAKFGPMKGEWHRQYFPSKVIVTVKTWQNNVM